MATSWREATQQALYGPDGFYRRAGRGPAGHFRTAAHVGDHLARALGRLLSDVDDALGRPSSLDVVDVGAGRGELFAGLDRHVSADLRARLRLTAVEVASAPPGLPGHITWTEALPSARTGLIVGHEWLDDVPLDVVEQSADGPRTVLVDPATGEETAGAPPAAGDAEWLARWWPMDGAAVGDRAEVGLPRDDAWADAVGCLDAGAALAVDYGHLRADRESGSYAAGTLTGYRAGRHVPPVPDGSCDITAHVALDACAEAGRRAGARATLLTTQRHALRALGVDGARPPRDLAARDPRAYVERLSRASEEAELIDRGGLGAFGWLLQTVGIDLPASLVMTPPMNTG